jgi:uncharacterized OB-fold protein
MLSEVIPGLQRPIPIPNDLSQPFWDGAKEQKLMLQKCSACGKLNYPPRANCNSCTAKDTLQWTEVQNPGAHIDVHLIIRDSRIRGFRSAQPINFAIIRLNDDPGINFLSNLPGTAPGEFKDGDQVELVFAAVEGSDQLIPEWQIKK